MESGNGAVRQRHNVEKDLFKRKFIGLDSLFDCFSPDCHDK